MDGRTGYVICATCGLIGHTMGSCPERTTAATIVPARPSVADVPRRCGSCLAPTIHTTDGRILDDRVGLRDRDHDCLTAVAA